MKTIARTLLFVRLIISDIFKYVRKKYVAAGFVILNPNSKVYEGAVSIDSVLEGFNILFYDTQIFNSTIGRHTYIQKNSTIVNATIGRFCSIASNVSIGPGIHKIDGVSTHPAFYLNNTPLLLTFSKSDVFESSKRTTIGHDVWIGEGVVVIDCVTIGNGAVVAAGAVVTKNIEPYSIVGGVPAKHIKYRFDSETIKALEESEWWNFSDMWFEKNCVLMLNPNELLKYLKSNGSGN